MTRILMAIFVGFFAFTVSALTQAETAPIAKNRLLWDEWYTVTMNGKVHYGYYNDRAEIKNGQIFVKNDYLKQEEDYINRENLGAVAENDDSLTPVLFNFHSVYRSTETMIDGSLKNRHFLTVRVKQGTQELPIIQRTLPAKTILSSLFSVWITKHLPELSEGKTLRFGSVLEDDIDQQFSVMDGSVKLEKPDAYAKTSGTQILRVDSRGITTLWWIDSKGIVKKIEMPEQKMVVERVTHEQAKKFLDGAT